MMTTKDYVAIAKIFKDNQKAIIHTDGKILDDFCDMFAKDNSNFNSALFMIAVTNRMNWENRSTDNVQLR